MGPKKQLAHLKKARGFISAKSQNSFIDDKRFVFSILVEGTSYLSTSKVFLWNNIKPTPPSTFYRIQREVGDVMLGIARESCAKWRSKIPQDCCISFDSSWSHRRNATQCLVDIIDTRNNKVIDFEVLEKNCGKFKGNFDGASNLMEVEGLKRIIPRLMCDNRITSYVHDKDSKTKKAITEINWNHKNISTRII